LKLWTRLRKFFAKRIDEGSQQNSAGIRALFIRVALRPCQLLAPADKICLLARAETGVIHIYRLYVPHALPSCRNGKEVSANWSPIAEKHLSNLVAGFAREDYFGLHPLKLLTEARTGCFIELNKDVAYTAATTWVFFAALMG